MADIIKTTAFQPSADAIVAAALVLKAGGIVVLPTDTVYCVAADLNNPEAVKRLYNLKGRSTDKGLPVLIGEVSQLGQIAVETPSELDILVHYYWPGALTIVLTKQPDVPDIVTGGLPTVAVRIPGGILVQSVLEEFGGALASSSANLSGGIAPIAFVDLDPEILEGADLAIDGGICPDGKPSTIIDVSGPVWTMLRTGRITREAIETAVGRVIE
jgi:L-threonylcarbamoyladenylate synthase